MQVLITQKLNKYPYIHGEQRYIIKYCTTFVSLSNLLKVYCPLLVTQVCQFLLRLGEPIGEPSALE